MDEHRCETGARARGRRSSALLLAAAAIAAAALGARASIVSSRASAERQVAVRRQLARAEAVRDGLEDVYVTEAPQAMEVAAARLRAEQLAIAAARVPEPDRSALVAQASTESAVADLLAATGPPLASDPRYLTADGMDVGRRLGDLRAGRRSSPRDPAPSQAAGDRAAHQAVGLSAATIPVGVAFLFGALAPGFPSWRGRFLLAGAACLTLALAWTVAVEAMA